MKLLRLTSREIDGSFSSDFNDNIELSPNSQIALQSISINADPLRINVNAQNNEIIIQWATATTRTITLTPFSYNSSNFESLLEDIANKCNASINKVGGETNKTIGMEWDCDRDASNKVVVQYQNGQASEYAGEWEQTGTIIRAPTGSTGNQGYWANNGADTTHTINHISLDKFISRGNGNVACRIGLLDATSNGYVIGLTKNEQAIINNTFTESDITYGIGVYGDGARKYKTYREGVVSTSAQAVGYIDQDNKNNDFQEIQIDGSKVKLNIYNQAGGTTPVNLAEFDYTAGEKLYPVLIFLGAQANVYINALSTTPSPFNPDLANFIADKYLPDFDDALGKPPRQITRPTNNRLSFGSDELAEFLGYNNRVNPVIAPLVATQASFQADRVFNVPEQADNYIIQLMNLQTESYDSFSSSTFASGGQRRNLLAIIPNTNLGNFVYYTPYPTFLDVKNKDTLILRNIKMRVLYTDYTPVSTSGLGSIVLLIKEN